MGNWSIGATLYRGGRLDAGRRSGGNSASLAFRAMRLSYRRHMAHKMDRPTCFAMRIWRAVKTEAAHPARGCFADHRSFVSRGVCQNPPRFG